MAADGVRTEGAVRDLEPAQERAALERALAGADAGPMKEPEEGDQWPMCRPLVELALAHLPEGGAGYDVHGFLVGQEDSDLLVLSEEAVDQVAQVLPALVSWAHGETEEDPLVSETVLGLMPELLADLPRRWAAKGMEVARLDAAAELALVLDDPVNTALALLVQQAGGVEALDGLGADPLPPEPLVLDEVPQDLHGRLTEIDAALVAGLGDVPTGQPPRPEGELDVELLTACRRFLVQAAVGDPDVLRGRASARSTAAAVAWVVGRREPPRRPLSDGTHGRADAGLRRSEHALQPRPTTPGGGRAAPCPGGRGYRPGQPRAVGRLCASADAP